MKSDMLNILKKENKLSERDSRERQQKKLLLEKKELRRKKGSKKYYNLNF